MQFVVNGKIFNSIEEAEREEKRQEVYKFLKYIKCFELSKHDDVKTLYVIAKSDWDKYALAVAGRTFGLMYDIEEETGNLIKNYNIRQVAINEDIASQIINASLNGGTIPSNIAVVNSLNLDEMKESNEKTENPNYGVYIDPTDVIRGIINLFS